MTVLLGILTFFIILGILILVHELGHFAFAKLFGVRVEEFGLGFPPRLKSWQRGDTRYSLNAIPLGGFVRMLGENGEAAESDSFGSKPPWQRFVILVSGATMNLLLAVLIFFVTFLAGSSRGLTIVTGVSPRSPAASAGLRVGDRIITVNGRAVSYLPDLQTATEGSLGRDLRLTLSRGGRRLSTDLVPRRNPPPNQGPMGIELSKTATVAYSPGTALHKSFEQVGLMIAGIPTLLQSISAHGGSQVTGPIGIAHLTTNVVRNEPDTGPSSLFQFVALLSANLGVLNLVPIPALDGGRIVFVLLSWVRRRNLDPEVEGVIHVVGMALLLLLILVVSYQDVARWVSGGSF